MNARLRELRIALLGPLVLAWVPRSAFLLVGRVFLSTIDSQLSTHPGLQRRHELFKLPLIRPVVPLLAAEIRNVILPYLPRRINPSVRIKLLPLLHFLKRGDRDRKRHLFLLPRLPLARVGNLRAYPIARHAVLREDQQQLVMHPNGFVNLLMNLPPALDVIVE